MFFERRDAQDLKHRMQRQRQVESLANDGDEHVRADRDPHLGFDRVLGCAEEPLDAQVLLDPFEKEFHLPTQSVQIADGHCRQCHVVGEENEPPPLLIPIADATQLRGIMLTRVKAHQLDHLIGEYAGAAIDGICLDFPVFEVRFGTRDEEAASQNELVEPLEIDIPAVHHIESTPLRLDQIEYVDIVQLPVADVDERWNTATQIELEYGA